ncbi:DUF1707 domain-containing protein [Nonomuraea sp. NPDC049400]|uniref:DUF1707 domain-containing protein n=1 Tax=Nonomuraea sp. NPDC049400 TaxID=3364352 RepID=UPI00378D4090
MTQEIPVQGLEKSSPPALRASDADRDRVTELLRTAVADGRLDLVEFDERLDAALPARTIDALAPLVTDLIVVPGNGGALVLPSTGPPGELLTIPDPEEAQAAGQALAAADRDGAGAGCTLGQWLARWPATKDALRPSTRQGYATHIRLYLIPHLGRIRMHQLTSRDVNRLLAALASRPSPTGRRLSPATVVRIHATLRTAQNAAVRARLIPVNPANGAELPHPRRPHPVIWTTGRAARRQQVGERPAVAVRTERQPAALLAGVAQDGLYAAWWLAALRGLRRGELAGRHQRRWPVVQDSRSAPSRRGRCSSIQSASTLS